MNLVKSSIVAGLLISGTAQAGLFDSLRDKIDELKYKIQSNKHHVVWTRTWSADYRFNLVGFDKDQGDKIQRSMDLMYNVLKAQYQAQSSKDDSKFVKCVMDNSTKNQAPNWKKGDEGERQYVYGIITGMMVLSSGPSNFIQAFTEDKATGKRDFIRAGHAPVNTLKGGMSTEIHLNTYSVGKKSERKLAGIIFHEMMHNLGWSHPSSGKGASDYPGTFIKEAQKCLVAEIPSTSTTKSLDANDDLTMDAE